MRGQEPASEAAGVNGGELSSPPRPQTVCFACGAEHPHGLRLRFGARAEGLAEAAWTPTSVWEGFQGIIHGGIVSTVLDEAMSKAVASSGSPAVTCRLEIRLRRRIVPGEGLTVRGWIVERKKRRIRAEAEIVDREGRERAHAWAVFLAPAQDERFPNTSR